MAIGAPQPSQEKEPVHVDTPIFIKQGSIRTGSPTITIPKNAVKMFDQSEVKQSSPVVVRKLSP